MWTFPVAACLLLTAACHSNNGEPADPVPGSEGKKSVSGLAYPKENIGTSVGNVIPDFAFPGFVDPAASQAPVEIRFAHFYNPTGSGTFGPNDPFEDGTPLPKIIVVNVSGKWCAPCKQEAAQVLPVQWQALHPKGLMLVTVLADSDKPGVAANIADLVAWTSSFQSRYPSVIDPTYQMGALFDQNQFPANFVIDAKTMKILVFLGGKPPDSFWDNVAGHL